MRCLVFLFLLGLSALPNAGVAADGKLEIVEPWSRATPGRAPNGVVYLTLRNGTDMAVTLAGAASPAAKKTALHTHKHEGGVMKMRPAGPVTVPAGGMVAFEPGGLHVMLMGLVAPLKEGDKIHLNLKFEDGTELSTMVPVLKVGASGPMHNKGHGHGKGHGKHSD